MNLKKTLSKLSQTFYAICFIITSNILIFILTWGWILLEWDPLGWTVEENAFISIASSFIIAFFGMLVLFLALFSLLSKKLVFKENLKYSLLSGLAAGFAAIIVSFSGILLFEDYLTVEPLFSVSLWGLYLSVLIMISFFALYIAWRDPVPLDDEELREWVDFIANNDIPAQKWMILYFVLYFFLPMGFIGSIAVLNVFLPNPLTSNAFFSYYLDEERFFTIFETIAFFPGAILHTISFCVYYWRPIKAKLDYSLWKTRYGESRYAKNGAKKTIT